MVKSVEGFFASTKSTRNLKSWVVSYSGLSLVTTICLTLTVVTPDCCVIRNKTPRLVLIMTGVVMPLIITTRVNTNILAHHLLDEAQGMGGRCEVCFAIYGHLPYHVTQP